MTPQAGLEQLANLRAKLDVGQELTPEEQALVQSYVDAITKAVQAFAPMLDTLRDQMTEFCQAMQDIWADYDSHVSQCRRCLLCQAVDAAKLWRWG